MPFYVNLLSTKNILNIFLILANKNKKREQIKPIPACYIFQIYHLIIFGKKRFNKWKNKITIKINRKKLIL
ncbi:hypothetical protein BpHYR1_028326 [Brachionus plicatilis]|uniref:Uncharacterized protein n=1 Tax=Brachionus plicatilis TaxID=10195 RepID=A0A3M7R4L1_BRAPC|nr:hypothetical protein BpHYR1_028326 [Brachionus plicatilis]